MHIPVLQKEVLEYLNPKKNENFIDCTVGEGGHTLAILEKIAPRGKVLGIDKDKNQIENCKLKTKKFQKRVILVCDNFANLKNIIEEYNFESVAGILLDLGMSSWHLEKSGRGFSFQKNEPLDMRYQIGNKNLLTAEKIINEWTKEEIGKILKDYGEEKFADKITKEIIEERKRKPIETTWQLIEIIKKAVPRGYQQARISPATKTFQALRIAVNRELDNLEKVLPQAIKIIKRGGILAVISFHSLEDRIVKFFFKAGASKNLVEILTQKPITPSLEEIRINPRSRSAKLRALRIKN